MLAQIALFVTLWFYAKRSAAFARESSARPIGTGMLLGMLSLAIVWLVHVPFALAAHYWQRRWDQATSATWNGCSRTGPYSPRSSCRCASHSSSSWGLRRLGDRWWLPGAAVFVGIAAFFSFVSPYLYYTTTPLKKDSLLEAASTYEQELGVGHIRSGSREVSADTDQANAFAFGAGPRARSSSGTRSCRSRSRRPRQKVVLAHELAHHSQEHLPKGLAWFALFAIPGAWILMKTTRRRGGMSNPAAVPLALLVVAVFQLATAPLSSAISRRMESRRTGRRSASRRIRLRWRG